MDKIKVFLAEDSSLIRGLIRSHLKKTSNIELTDIAIDGEQAVEKLKVIDVDIIILDIVMPKIDGIEVLKKIRKTNKKTPIIMYSSLTTDSAAAHTVTALTLGATDFCQKPMGFGGKTLSADQSIDCLVKKIEKLFLETRKKQPYTQTTCAIPSDFNYDLIVIGCSTGGPEALNTIFSKISGQLPPVLITQHMPENFTALLARNLNKLNNITVQEAFDGQELSPANVYVAPGDYHMLLTKEKNYTLKMNQEACVNFCRPSVDVMFKSVAEVFEGRILSIILTGMGNDGLEGCKALKSKQKANITIQDKMTSVVWGMPSAIYNENIHDNCLPLDEIQSLMTKISNKPIK